MKQKPAKPFNGGTWTASRMKSFAISAIRRAHWGPKYASIARAYVKDGINPATGKPCKLHKCEECGKLFPKGQMQADHKEPVVPADGKWGNTTEWLGINFNEYLPRMWVEAAHYNALDKECHKKKTKAENQLRRENRK
jgi:5-methylcytosine-specific restriction endonuclease McrA